MEEQEPASSTPKPGGPAATPGGSWGRGRFNATPRSERKSLEVFGGAPASTRYLPGAGTSFGGATVPEGNEQIEPPPPRVVSPPWELESPRIDPPWAAPTVLAPNASTITPSMWSTPQPQAPPSLTPSWSKPETSQSVPKPSPPPWEVNLDIPEYKPKPVIGADEMKPKPVVRHQRSSSDTMRNTLPDLEEERQSAIRKEERQNAINKLKMQVNA